MCPMNIIQTFKAAGQPKTADFVARIAQQQWPREHIYDACLYAAENNCPHLFEWSYTSLMPASKHHLDPKVLTAASHHGHSFVVDRVCTTPLTNVDPKHLFTNAAEKGHLEFIRALQHNVGLSEDNRARILIQAARKGHCVMLQEYAPARLVTDVVHMLFKSASQNGQLDVVKWLEQHPSCHFYTDTGRCFERVAHEAVANAHPQLLKYFLEDNAWKKARTELGKKQFDQHMISNLKVLLNTSQNSEKNHATALVLARHISLQKWEKAQRTVNPWHKQYLEAVYAESQKMILENAISAVRPSEKTRRKM